MRNGAALVRSKLLEPEADELEDVACADGPEARRQIRLQRALYEGRQVWVEVVVGCLGQYLDRHDVARRPLVPGHLLAEYKRQCAHVHSLLGDDYLVERLWHVDVGAAYRLPVR